MKVKVHKRDKTRKRRMLWLLALATCVGFAACNVAFGNSSSSSSSSSPTNDSSSSSSSSSSSLTEDTRKLEEMLAEVTGEYTLQLTGTRELRQMLLGVSLGSNSVEKIVCDGGESGAEIIITGDGGGEMNSIRANNDGELVFKNITFSDATYTKMNWKTWATEWGGKLTFENCTFESEILLKEDAQASFTNCAFTSTDSSRYGLWILDGSATLSGCTFTGYRGIKIHEANAKDDVVSVTVVGCTFSNLASKPAFAFGSFNQATAVTVKNCTMTGCQAWADDAKEGIDGFYEADDILTSEFTFVSESNMIDGVSSDTLTPQFNGN